MTQEPPSMQLFLALSSWSQKSLKRLTDNSSYSGVALTEPLGAPLALGLFLISCEAGIELLHIAMIPAALPMLPPGCQTPCKVVHAACLVWHVKHLEGLQPQPQGCKFLHFKCACPICSSVTQKFKDLYILCNTIKHLTRLLLRISLRDINSSRLVRRKRHLFLVCALHGMFWRFYTVGMKEVAAQSSRVDVLVYSFYVIFHTYPKTKHRIQRLALLLNSPLPQPRLLVKLVTPHRAAYRALP